MNSINHIKKLFSSFFSIVLFIGLISGCASVTDANLDTTQETEQTVTESSDSEQETDSEDIWYNSNGDDMDPIREEPPPPSGD